MTKIGFIGAGNMAEAIIQGVIQAQVVDPSDIWISDVNQERCDILQHNFSVNAAENNKELLQNVDMAILAIKPQVAQEVLADLKDLWTANTVCVSIMAGKTLEFLAQLGEDIPAVRVMPNTPALVGQGMSALSASSTVSEDQKDKVEQVFASVGQCVWVPEDQMNAVTAVSGSGPAYIYAMGEAMIAAAQEQGLSAEAAEALVLQTITGAAAMMTQTNDSPQALREKVSSPGGTTLAGLTVLDKEGFRGMISKVVGAAAQRAREL